MEVLGDLEVHDPYRWLEDGDDPEVRAWARAQGAHTRRLLEQIGGREALHRRLSELVGAPTSEAPAVGGDLVFSLDRWGERDQAALVARAAGGATPGEARLVLDPIERTGDATAAIDWHEPSRDGSLVAVGISTGGDERSTLHVVDARTGALLDDVIAHTRAASMAWLPDSSGFAYTRYPAPGAVPEGEEHYHRTLWWHRLGDDPADDAVLWDALADPVAWPEVSLSPDGRWVLVHASLGWSRTDVHLLDREDGRWRTVVEGVEATSAFELDGDRLVGVTTLGADRGRLVEAPLTDPGPERWRSLLTEGAPVLDRVAACPGTLLVLATRTAVSQLRCLARDGTGATSVELPEPGTVGSLVADPDHDRAFFSFTSFMRPPCLLRWEAGALDAWSPASTVVDPGAYDVRQLRTPSSDGTQVPYFLIGRTGGAGPAPGPRPTVLTGYGGFAVTLSPTYSPAAVAICDAGGRYAVANIRGGAEEGEAWHRGGMRDRKQQSIDDFLAVAERLVADGLTDPAHLALRGGSNGGLLVSAALTQRPDACRAVHAAVPLTDMVRYHRFSIARLWIPEYGDPEDPDELRWLHAYSPYHQVRDGTCYPAVLVTAGEEDSRVDPAHARKLAARLQAATSCGDRHPILLRLEPRAGHGQGKPVSRQVDELCDVLSFLSWQLDGLTWSP